MKKIIALLDKQYPPDHSFVNGMLATTLPHEKDIEIDLLVSRHSFHKVCRYKKAVCLPLLYPRKGICRFLNFIKAVCILNKLIERNKSKEIILFVRNEPIYLLACTFVKKKEIKIIFQSSFPHERALVNFFKRWVARWIYKIAGRRVDSLLSVSPKGLKRLQKLIPHAQKANFIPLMSESTLEVNNFELKCKNKNIRFIYVGDHSLPRKLEVVLKAIVRAINNGLLAEFKFIGGEPQDIKRLLNVYGVEKLKKKGILKFIQKIPRKYLWNEFMDSDVGLSLIPPDEHYIEASPTKLSEYMRAGLAVLASNGIELQEEFVKKSSGGVLCDWNEDDIVKSLIDLSINKAQLKNLKKRGYKYSILNLNYRNYINTFRDLIT